MQSFEEFCTDFETKKIFTLRHTLTAYDGTPIEAYRKLMPLDPFALISRFDSAVAPRIALMAITRSFHTIGEASVALGTLQSDCDGGFCLGFIPFEAYYAEFPEKLPEADHPIVLYHPELTLSFYDHCTEIIFQTLDRTNLSSHYERGRALIQSAIHCLSEKTVSVPRLEPCNITFSAALSANAYRDMLEKAKQSIVKGDIFQVVLSNTFTAELAVDPLVLYDNLLTVNPSDYAILLRTSDAHLLISSPEMMVYQDKKLLKTLPIAGTRGVKNDGRDKVRGEKLLADQKERAEHLMLVDLARNDLSRCSLPGTVVVSDYSRIKMFPRVMHLVSTVTGKPLPDLNPLDGLSYTFPAGTVSGAPKVRAVQLIHELEPHPRVYYGGSLFINNYSFTTESCIAIRTIVHRSNTIQFQIGSGIVHASTVNDESMELKHKGRALLEAIEKTIGGRASFDTDY